MSGKCVQSVKMSTRSAYILRVVQLSHCRTSVRQGLRNTWQSKKALFYPGDFRKTWPVEPIIYSLKLFWYKSYWKMQWTQFSNIINWFFFILTTTIRANIYVFLSNSSATKHQMAMVARVVKLVHIYLTRWIKDSVGSTTALKTSRDR